jgi:hypothetical protein
MTLETETGQLPPELFLGTLLHEVAHAYSGAPDVDEEFEQALTHLLGRTGMKAVVD